MVISNLFSYGFWRVLGMICSKWNMYVFIKTRKGLKNINVQRLYSDSKIEYDPEDVISISPSNLYLSTDYLKDKYTLLDCCILDSPHYSFIEAINSGGDIKKTDYYRRYITGCLDGRHALRARDLSYFSHKNKEAKRAIEEESYQPVVVYFWKNRYYLCDGKHRAALCAYMKKDVKCIVIPPISDFCHAAINKEIYRIMSCDKQYSKHISFIENGEK